MARYSIGDVVRCDFSFEDDPSQSKDRLALVLAVHPPPTEDVSFTITKITKSVNRAAFRKGILVDRNSQIGKTMRLDYSSFIELDNQIVVKKIAIDRKIGKHPNMDDVFNFLSDNDITIKQL